MGNEMISIGDSNLENKKKKSAVKMVDVEIFAAVAVRCAGIESWKQRIFL